MGRSGNLMIVGPYLVGIHFPPERQDRSRSLAPLGPWDVHNVADYSEKCPSEWNIGTPSRGAFFFGTEVGRELWFDFRPNETMPHFLAATITVQGLNAISGLPALEGVSRGEYMGRGQPTLEQYRHNCPVHGTPFKTNRLCQDCGFKWPAQNYITNAAGQASKNEFWRDGWRTAEGLIRQFVLRAAQEGVGVAQQMLGEARTLAIDIVMFRSENPKPPPASPIYHGSGRLGGLDEESDLCTSELPVQPFPFGGFDNRPGLIGSSRSSGERESSDTRRIGVPSQMEVAAGREVNQEVHPDPNDLNFWHPDPVVLFTLFPTDIAWVQEVTRNGPMTRELEGGAFAGIKTAG